MWGVETKYGRRFAARWSAHSGRELMYQHLLQREQQNNIRGLMPWRTLRSRSSSHAGSRVCASQRLQSASAVFAVVCRRDSG